MQLQERIKALEALGNHIENLPEEEKLTLAERAAYYNPWFTVPNVQFALEGIRKFLTRNSLEKLTKAYNFNSQSKTVGIIMAGNIPLVGFHDLLCVLLTGHKAMIKLSTKDEVLPNFIFEQLKEIAPDLAESIVVVDRMKDFDAVIATGSDNTSRYFDYYFSKYPNVIRKNRTSIAVVNGKETQEELLAIADDMLLYFGLGCRNISKLLVPTNYEFRSLFEALEKYKEVANHNKYRNNYDYYKSIYLVNREDFLDNGFIMFKEDKQLVSPVSVVFYEKYSNMEQAEKYLQENKDKIQVIVASEKLGLAHSIPPGKAQLPEIDDFADQVDTMAFLTSL